VTPLAKKIIRRTTFQKNLWLGKVNQETLSFKFVCLVKNQEVKYKTVGTNISKAKLI